MCLFKIKLIGFPGSGKSTHLKLWKPFFNFHIINENLLNENDLTKSTLERQHLILDRFNIKGETHNKVIFDHTPIEMIKWYTNYFYQKNELKKIDFEEMIEKIEMIEKEEEKIFDKIIYLNFCNEKEFIKKNIETRGRKNETFDESCFEYIKRQILLLKIETHFCTLSSDVYEYNTLLMRSFIDRLTPEDKVPDDIFHKNIRKYEQHWAHYR